MVYLESCSAKSFFLHIQLIAGMAAYLYDALYSLMKGFLALSHSKFGRVALLLPFKEGVQKKTFFWDFVPNIGPHSPTAHVWDSTKRKIKVKFILLFRLVRAFYFFEKN